MAGSAAAMMVPKTLMVSTMSPTIANHQRQPGRRGGPPGPLPPVPMGVPRVGGTTIPPRAVRPIVATPASVLAAPTAAILPEFRCLVVVLAGAGGICGCTAATGVIAGRDILPVLLPRCPASSIIFGSGLFSASAELNDGAAVFACVGVSSDRTLSLAGPAVLGGGSRSQSLGSAEVGGLFPWLARASIPRTAAAPAAPASTGFMPGVP